MDEVEGNEGLAVLVEDGHFFDTDVEEDDFFLVDFEGEKCHVWQVAREANMSGIDLGEISLAKLANVAVDLINSEGQFCKFLNEFT